MWDHWAVGPLGCGNKKIVEMWDHWAVGPLGCGTIGMAPQRAVGGHNNNNNNNKACVVWYFIVVTCLTYVPGHLR